MIIIHPENLTFHKQTKKIPELNRLVKVLNIKYLIGC